MVYVQKRGGVVVGVFRQPQPQEDGSTLTEPDELPDNHPDVLAYLAPKPEPARLDVAAEIGGIKARLAALEAKR